MRSEGFVGCVATLALLVLGCSDPEPKPPSDGGAGTPAAAGAGPVGSGGSGSNPEPGEGGASGSPAAPACNELGLDDTPAYSLGYNSKPHNLPEGGAIPDGTYLITAQILFEAADGPVIEMGRTKVTIAGDVWQEVSGDAEAGGVNPDRHSTSTFTLDGATLTLTRTCPTARTPEAYDYAADEYGFTVYVLDSGESIGTVFTRQ